MSSMVEKKQPGRFTLQFNLKDPQQQTVSELLEQQGRHKAQFITSSVLLYIQCSKPQGHNEGPPAIDEVELEQILLSIMEKNPRFAAAAPSDPPGAEDPPAQTTPAARPWEKPIGDDALRAINDTLAAFQQK